MPYQSLNINAVKINHHLEHLGHIHHKVNYLQKKARVQHISDIYPILSSYVLVTLYNCLLL